MLEDSKKRNLESIAIFRASRQSVSSLSTVTAVYRFACLIFGLHLPLWFMSSVKMTGLVANLYGGTFGAGILALCLRIFKQRLARDFVLRIDFDVKAEVFVITMPPTNFTALGEPFKLLVAPSDFQMLSKDAQLNFKACLYYDTKSGTRFATIERGQWYNQGLLLHLLQKQKRPQSKTEQASPRG